PRPPPVIPGRSLGNPAKKARRIETVEFEDDSEEEKAASKAQKKRRKA
ncbi:1166_t:CDS:1, partial [Acaulospora colombiana]